MCEEGGVVREDQFVIIESGACSGSLLACASQSEFRRFSDQLSIVLSKPSHGVVYEDSTLLLALFCGPKVLIYSAPPRTRLF